MVLKKKVHWSCLCHAFPSQFCWEKWIFRTTKAPLEMHSLGVALFQQKKKKKKEIIEKGSDCKSANKVQIFENIQVDLVRLLCAAELAIYPQKGGSWED